MNFLAHAFLSGNDPQILTGNFMGDFVKGDPMTKLPTGIGIGVLLHRAIDEFTDQHAVVRQSKERLRPKYRHYASVIVDIYYDHFLAKNFLQFSNSHLLPYSLEVYATLQNYQAYLPEKTSYMLRFMERDNWLYHYASMEGIGRALNGMSHRARFDSKMNESINDLTEHYNAFENEFRLFFPELQVLSSQFLSTQIKKYDYK